VALTERQQNAQRALAYAIEEQRRAFLEGTDTDTPEVVADWLLIAACVSYDKDGDQYVSYHMAFPDDTMMDHRAVGLAQQAIYLLHHGQRVYGEDGRSE
jgi:hypothetical protein